jgi:hypothetical protein
VLDTGPPVGVHLQDCGTRAVGPSLGVRQGTSGVCAEFSPRGHSDDMRRESHPGTLPAKNHEFTPSYDTADGSIRVVKTLEVVRR